MTESQKRGPRAAKSQVGSLDWWRQRYRNEANTSSNLNREMVVEAALQIVDSDGLAALTMRRLANMLGTGASTLYNQIGGVAEVYLLLADRIVHEVRFPAPSGDWKTDARIVAESYWEVLMEHPNIVPLLRNTPLLGRETMRARDQGMAMLIAGGLSPQQATDTYVVLGYFVAGLALMSTNGAARTPATLDDIRAFIDELDATEFPVVSQYATEFTKRDVNAQFELGLNALLDGLEVQFSKSSNPN